MPKIEISDRIGSWGFGGRNYRPGIWEVDVATAEAAERSGIKAVRRLPDEVEPAIYDGTADRSGELTERDLREGNEDSDRTECPACGASLLNRNMEKHVEKVHGGVLPEPPAEPEPEEPDTSCPDCEGTGFTTKDGEPVGCDACGGTGQRPEGGE